MLSAAVRAALRCPWCGGHLDLDLDAGRLHCTGCSTAYPADAGAADLRLQRPRDVAVPFRLGEAPVSHAAVAFAPLIPVALSAVDFTGTTVPEHLTAAILSHFPAASDGDLALDLGCGWGVHRPVIERAGFEWVGLDYFEPAAPILGDAHALPFGADSFDFILTIAVLEHLRYPFVAMGEAMRVLRPGKLMIGTVAFLEPFHGDSHYHHSALGTLNTLLHAGFEVDAVAPHADWGVIRAQVEMGLLPSSSARMRELLVRTVDRVTRRSWRRAGLDENSRVSNHAGAFTFIARKPSR